MLGEEKDRKTGKSRSEEKVVGFSSAFLFPTRKWEAVTQGENCKDRLPNNENNPRSQYYQRLGGQVRLLYYTKIEIISWILLSSSEGYLPIHSPSYTLSIQTFFIYTQQCKTL